MIPRGKIGYLVDFEDKIMKKTAKTRQFRSENVFRSSQCPKARRVDFALRRRKFR